MNGSNSVRLTLIEARAWGLPLPTARATIAKTNDQCRLHIDTRNVTFLEQGEVSAEAPPVALAGAIRRARPTVTETGSAEPQTPTL
jgi:hypothetical protein